MLAFPANSTFLAALWVSGDFLPQQSSETDSLCVFWLRYQRSFARPRREKKKSKER